jgi:RNA polymerase sigma factor (sigma-70 family)
MSTENCHVKDGHPAENSRARRFWTTKWQMVLDSQDVESPRHRQALAELCSIYWYPLYQFARRKGFEAQDSEDLTQSFFLHLLKNGALQQVHPDKGRFRSFLLASFQNHISVLRQRQVAAKRGGGCLLISLDAPRAEELDRFEAADNLTAETLFDAQWARVLLARVMSQLSENYQLKGKQAIFERLSGHLTVEIDRESAPYEEAAKALGLSPGAVKTLVFRMRKHFRRLLREEVARTVLDPSDIDAEIRALYEALIAAEGRL